MIIYSPVFMVRLSVEISYNSCLQQALMFRESDIIIFLTDLLNPNCHWILGNTLEFLVYTRIS